MNIKDNIPRWELDTIYPGLESPAYTQAVARLTKLFGELEKHLARPFSQDTFPAWLSETVRLQNESGALAESLSAYAYSSYATDTTNQKAINSMNELDRIALTGKDLAVRFRNILSAHKDKLEHAYAVDPPLVSCAWLFEHSIFLQSKQMESALEHLAEDMQRSGGDAWSKLHEQIISNISVVWDDQSGETKPFNEVRNLAYDGDRAVRKKAYEKELEALRSAELSTAACLNGIKGATITLNDARRWHSALEKSLFQARMTEKTLNALVSAMEESLPFWRTYLGTKARLLGVGKCAFYDLFAPVGTTGKQWTFAEARDFIIDRFSAFSPDMGHFAREAFDKGWIDAEIRTGKAGGAFCIDFPVQKVSRILSNFTGCFSDVTTLAHELGHAYHHYCIKDLPYGETQYPMTLAETASTFAETVILKETLKTAPASEKAALLEMHLQDGCQIIVDILCRFYFEKSVFERRRGGELSAAEFCALMESAQERTYGSGLSAERHPYMWAVKSHYNSPDLDFYNFPYAFGLLFALALYSRCEKEGPAFAETYKKLLLETGKTGCEQLCRSAGFDIERKEFWLEGLLLYKNELEELKAAAGPA